jgi:hypothetical protein
MKALVPRHYPQAQTIRLVQDNLNTHSVASLDEAFPPDEALELAQKFDVHYTRKKWSWLNLVEIEWPALSRQWLNRRIGAMDILTKEVKAWERTRNQPPATVQWPFTKEAARQKFQRHYLITRN